MSSGSRNRRDACGEHSVEARSSSPRLRRSRSSHSPCTVHMYGLTRGYMAAFRSRQSPPCLDHAHQKPDDFSSFLFFTFFVLCQWFWVNKQQRQRERALFARESVAFPLALKSSHGFLTSPEYTEYTGPDTQSRVSGSIPPSPALQFYCRMQKLCWAPAETGFVLQIAHVVGWFRFPGCSSTSSSSISRALLLFLFLLQPAFGVSSCGEPLQKLCDCSIPSQSVRIWEFLHILQVLTYIYLLRSC